jgi:iron(II)-dependent oxidoreductase
MKNWIKYTLAAVMVTAAMFSYSRNLHRSVPSDFRDAPRSTAMDSLQATDPAGTVGEGSLPVPHLTKGFVSAAAPSQPVAWVTIPGGKFTMGTEDFKDAQPVHKVDIRTFDMSKTPVTVEQYAECVSKGACAKPMIRSMKDMYCNWGEKGRERHPINCVTWDQANQYAKFKNARLPSEAEWEYAATSGGRNQKYPWGNDEPTCDRAVMRVNRNMLGCGKNSTVDVCSRPAGNTAQGLCDMAGNVSQWVQDGYQDSYKGAPVDGSAFKGEAISQSRIMAMLGTFTGNRVLRGGSFASNGTKRESLRANDRSSYEATRNCSFFGFRIARSK